MRVKILGSSSEGNCYLLQAEKETLILECGVKFSDIKKALNFDIRSVVGCLVTHEHRDHSKALVDCLRYGIKVLALSEVFESHRTHQQAFCVHIEPYKGYRIGGFKLRALTAIHDVPCVAYEIEHPESGRILFATDTKDLGYTDDDGEFVRFPFSGVNHIFIECNYCRERLFENIDNGIVPPDMRRRLEHTHMELQTTKAILRDADLNQVSDILLVHLSPNNGDEERFKREVEELTGIPTEVAKAGMELEISKNPF